MFEHDHSAARGMMATQKLIVFKHETALGNAHANNLFKAVKIAKKQTVEVPRDFEDYDVALPAKSAFPGVEIIEK
jgi:CRISPR-associated protein Csd2